MGDAAALLRCDLPAETHLVTADREGATEALATLAAVDQDDARTLLALSPSGSVAQTLLAGMARLGLNAQLTCLALVPVENGEVLDGPFLVAAAIRAWGSRVVRAARSLEYATRAVACSGLRRDPVFAVAVALEVQIHAVPTRELDPPAISLGAPAAATSLLGVLHCPAAGAAVRAALMRAVRVHPAEWHTRHFRPGVAPDDHPPGTTPVSLQMVRFSEPAAAAAAAEIRAVVPPGTRCHVWQDSDLQDAVVCALPPRRLPAVFAAAHATSLAAAPGLAWHAGSLWMRSADPALVAAWMTTLGLSDLAATLRAPARALFLTGPPRCSLAEPTVGHQRRWLLRPAPPDLDPARVADVWAATTAGPAVVTAVDALDPGGDTFSPAFLVICSPADCRAAGELCSTGRALRVDGRELAIRPFTATRPRGHGDPGPAPHLGSPR